MGSPVNETGLVKQIVKAVRAEYPRAWVFKVHGGPMQMTGVPDLIFCIEGLLVGCEVKFKRPGESVTHARQRTTQNQRVQIQRINRAGGIAGTVISPEEALDLIARGFKKQEAIKRRHENTTDEGGA